MKRGDFRLAIEIVDGLPVLKVEIPCQDMQELDQLLAAMKEAVEVMVAKSKENE